MRIRTVLAPFAAALMFMMAGHAMAASRSGPPVTSFDLENGMKIVVIEDHRAPVVTHMVWYRVGAADEDPGKSGIAHFLEHLLFKGTDTVEPGEFSKVVAMNGGSDNAFTSADFTAYHQRIARDRLGLLMKYEADRMTGLRLNDEEIETERQVVLEERSSRTDSRPGSLLNEQLNAALYQNHPYGRPIIGWEHEIKALTRADILEFYRRHYMPASAILVVAGDVEPEEVKKLAEETYGKVANPAPLAELNLERNRPLEPPSIAPRRVAMSDARVASPRISRLYLTPSYSTASKGEAAGLELLAEILGSGSTSRLYRELVVRRGIAVDAGAWFSGGSLDSGEFGVYAILPPGGDLAKAEAALDEVIASIAKDGVTETELARAKTTLVAEVIYGQDSQSRLARNFGSALTTGSTIEDVLNWPDVVRAATEANILSALKSNLRPERSVTGTLIPAAAGSRS